ncbi:hypothetical protein BDV06DRAFT_196036 [Aspergillus oleicola]
MLRLDKITGMAMRIWPAVPLRTMVSGSLLPPFLLSKPLKPLKQSPHLPIMRQSQKHQFAFLSLRGSWQAIEVLLEAAGTCEGQIDRILFRTSNKPPGRYPLIDQHHDKVSEDSNVLTASLIAEYTLLSPPNMRQAQTQEPDPPFFLSSMGV